MQLTLCLPLLLLLAVFQSGYGSSIGSASDITVKNCGVANDSPIDPDRIIGGKNAKRGAYPFIVSIRKAGGSGKYKHWCGGSIINENWILTAAHCFDGSRYAIEYEVAAGLYRLSKENEPQVRKYDVDEIFIPDYYNKKTFKGDIALLKLEKPIDIKGSKGLINGICLPEDKEDPKGFVTIVGWGITEEDGKYPDALQKITVPLISREECTYPYPWTVFDTTICAGKPGQDACKGDSGGPVFQTDNNGVATLVGTVSHSIGCAREDYPGVHQKVSMYRDWIDGIIANN